MGEGRERERAVAEHILRYGLTTPGALRALVLPDATDKAVSRLLERLVESSWLGRRRLPGGGRYFVLGPGAAEVCAATAGKSFGYQALVNRIGVLHFCARVGVQVFTASEFRGRFPELAKAGLPAVNYYVDRGDVNRLGFIHVDHGRTAERLVSKLNGRLVSRYRDEDFAALIQADRFVIAVATPTEEKARAVAEQVEGGGPRRARVRVEPVPELLPLLLERPPGRKAEADDA